MLQNNRIIAIRRKFKNNLFSNGKKLQNNKILCPKIISESKRNIFTSLPVIGGAQMIVECNKTKMAPENITEVIQLNVSRSSRRKLLLVPVFKRDKKTLIFLISNHVHHQSHLF